MRMSPDRMVSTAKILIAGAVGLIIGTVTATLGTVAFVESQALKVAKPLIEARVVPLENSDLRLQVRIENLEVDVRDQAGLEGAFRRNVLAKLDALCRAMPRAGCPLGENDK